MMTIIIVFVPLTATYLWTVRRWLTTPDGMLAAASMTVGAGSGANAALRLTQDGSLAGSTEGDLARRLLAGTLDADIYRAAMATVAARHR